MRPRRNEDLERTHLSWSLCFKIDMCDTYYGSVNSSRVVIVSESKKRASVGEVSRAQAAPRAGGAGILGIPTSLFTFL